ncbi:MAG: MFS transporter [Pseudomonadota bacterium]
MAKETQARGMTREEKKVIIASSAGTVFEWYDFFLYGSLAAMIGDQFFSSFPEATRNIFALLAFAAGFLVRPLGALVFGRLGDTIGRKYTFLMTIMLMGVSTFLVGFLPGYGVIGAAAPIILICLRIFQGLALGGEYGGAVAYVAEHAPHNKRGAFTSWINSTATLGFLLSLVVIMVARLSVGEQAFKEWGWRLPFIFSIVLLIISAYIRLQMSETPAFRKIKEEGRQSNAPIMEAFGEWRNFKNAFATFIGIASGLTVIFYTAHFYTLFFLQNVLRVDMFTSTLLVAASLIIGSFAYVFFGKLSDRIGRKPVILTGFVLAAVSTFPAYHFITETANPQLDAAQKATHVRVTADPSDCSFQFNPAGTSKFTSSCDVAKALLTKNSVNYDVVYEANVIPAKVHIAGKDIVSYEVTKLTPEEAPKVSSAFAKNITDALYAAGYPSPEQVNTQIVKISRAADMLHPQALKIIIVLSIMVVFSAMAYAPAAAAMAELFPTRIRYTGMSFPYNLGTGWFGGLMPAAAYAMSTHSGNIYFGLWYPVVIVAISFISVLLIIPETSGKDIFADD